VTGQLPLERRTVSRKTPGDGRLELTRETARKIERLGPAVAMDLAGELLTGELGTLDCTCRGADKPHVHYFIQAEELRRLVPGSQVEISLDAAGERLCLRPESSDPSKEPM
jgi:hypothetical protein